ncbi:hypothetical protein GCM10009849_11830 [Sinomonas flava]|uniref:Acyltransferase family protein n=1 Tax=Sinomonas flava TaxID=496857 RepID=A0ABN3BP77_9MICC
MRRFRELDGFRVIALLAVVVYHFTGAYAVLLAAWGLHYLGEQRGTQLMRTCLMTLRRKVVTVK